MATKRLFIAFYSVVFVGALVDCVVAQSDRQLPPPGRPNDSAEQLPPSRAYLASDRLPSTYPLSLADAKARVLENSVIMELASTQIAAKCYTMQAAEKDYLPKLLNAFTYFHFDNDLGRVLTTP